MDSGVSRDLTSYSLVGGRLTAEPPPILYDHYPVSGPQGVPIYFNILYRLASEPNFPSTHPPLR